MGGDRKSKKKISPTSSSSEDERKKKRRRIPETKSDKKDKESQRKNKSRKEKKPEEKHKHEHKHHKDDRVMQGHPKAKTLKASPLAFSELDIALFEGTSATGSRVYAPSSTRERIVVSSSSFVSHVHTTQNEEEDDEEKGQNVTPSPHDVSSVDSSNVTPSPHSSRSKKKSKTKVDMDELVLKMRSALHTLVARQNTVTTTLDACFERLNTLGLDPRDPLYEAAVDIFGHSTLLRETWLINPPDTNILKDWILRTARRLGFME